MSRYNDTRYKNPGSGKFLTRYAESLKAKAEIYNIQEKEEFAAGYKKGNLRIALASKHLHLSYAGLDKYVEEKDGLPIIWKREGDQIVRLTDDTSWIDELLKLEGTR